MKSLTAGMISHIAGEVTTLAYCWSITRRDGVIKAFTTHVEDLVVGGITYLSAVGSYSTTNVKSGSDLAVDNLDVDVVFDSAAITESDLLGGLYDGAVVQLFLVNYKDLTQGTLILRSGKIGEVKSNGSLFTSELRGLTQALQQTIGREHGKRCDAQLFDARCGLSSSGFLVSGTITAVTSKSVITLSTPPARAGGVITFTSGANANVQMEIKQLTGSVATLFLEMPFTIAIGDGYTALPGCDLNLSTCRDIYSNVINFRGFPYIPGRDKALSYPDAK